MTDILNPPAPPVAEPVAAGWTCKYCDREGSIRTYWETSLVARPLGTFSLSGHQLKVSALPRPWPFARCMPSLGGCGHISKGQEV